MLYRRHVRSSDDLPNWQNIEKKDREQGAVNSLADRLTSMHAWHLYWLRHPETLLSGHCERNVAFWTVKSESLLSGHRNFAFWTLSQKHCCLDTMTELLLSGHSHKHCFLDTESETLLFGHWQECCFLDTIISFAFWTLSQKRCYLDTVTEVFLSGHSHERCFLDTWVRNIELTLLESKMFHRVLTLTEEKKKKKCPVYWIYMSRLCFLYWPLCDNTKQIKSRKRWPLYDTTTTVGIYMTLCESRV